MNKEKVEAALRAYNPEFVPATPEEIGEARNILLSLVTDLLHYAQNESLESYFEVLIYARKAFLSEQSKR
jgi:hypothetical protein